MSNTAADTLRRTIIDFASGTDPSAMLLRGEWGVGKTYACTAALKNLTESNPKFRYSYVSLYGVTTQEDIYTRMLIGIRIGKTANLPDWATEAGENLGKIFNGVASMAAAGGLATATAGMLGMLARNTLVVLDDMERRDEALTIRSVMGTVSYLTESRDCRVILISNDKALNDEDASVFQIQKERVFDIEYHYQPTVKENLRLMATKENFEMLCEPVDNLGTRNLRAIKRTDTLLSIIRHKLSDKSPRTNVAILKNAAVLGMLHHAFRGKVNLATRSDKAYLAALMANYGGSPKPEQSEQDKILAQANYEGGPGDKRIADFLTNGQIDWNDLAAEAVELELEAEARERNSSLSQLFQSISANYQLDEATLIKQLLEICQDHAEQIAPGNLKHAAWLLTQLGHKASLDEWYARWLAANLPKLGDNQLSDNFLWREEFPAEILAAFKQELTKRRKTICDIHTPMVRRFCEQSWSPSDHDLLAKLPQAAFTSWIANSNDERLGHIIHQALKEFPAGAPAEQKISKKIEVAVRTLAKKSKINKLRLRYYTHKP